VSLDEEVSGPRILVVELLGAHPPPSDAAAGAGITELHASQRGPHSVVVLVSRLEGTLAALRHGGLAHQGEASSA
jgi:hypothetical protein